MIIVKRRTAGNANSAVTNVSRIMGNVPIQIAIPKDSSVKVLPLQLTEPSGDKRGKIAKYNLI